MRRTLSLALALALVASSSALAPGSRVAVFGGTGYVGSEVCSRLISKGYAVTGASRRGVNPKPGNEVLDKVDWTVCDASDPAQVKRVVRDADAVVHAVGLLFDVDSGLSNLNTVVSGSGSLPGESSTYEVVTRRTMFNVIEALEAKNGNNPLAKLTGGGAKETPLCFVSCAEAGWPDVAGGTFVEENLAPEWLRRYLVAKRAVERRLNDSKGGIRPVVYRPSLIWSWDKLDVLPVIPVFNVASAVGVPFVDKTVKVGTLADAIVRGLEDDEVRGVQRYMNMEQLAKTA